MEHALTYVEQENAVSLDAFFHKIFYMIIPP